MRVENVRFKLYAILLKLRVTVTWLVLRRFVINRIEGIGCTL